MKPIRDVKKNSDNRQKLQQKYSQYIPEISTFHIKFNKIRLCLGETMLAVASSLDFYPEKPAYLGELL